MLFLVSPAKKMVEDDLFGWRDIPRFLPDSERLLGALRRLSYEEAKAVWKCSDALAELNYARVADMDLRARLTPAVFAYEGIQYQNLAPRVMTSEQLEYLQRHLRILSGFYGVLRPFDGVTAYRLEMQARLTVEGAANLYEYWGSRLFESLAEEESGEALTLVNLASVEYAKAVEPHARACDSARWITCLFGTVRDDRLVQRSTEAKAARGTFMRWCAENAVRDVEDFLRFSVAGYRYNEELSTADTLVFAH